MRYKTPALLVSLFFVLLLAYRVDAQQQGFLIAGPTVLNEVPKTIGEPIQSFNQSRLWVESVYTFEGHDIYIYLFDADFGSTGESIEVSTFPISCNGEPRFAQSAVFQGSNSILIYEAIESGYTLIFVFPDVDLSFCDFIQEFLVEWRFFRVRQDSIIPPPFPAILNFQ